MIADSISRRFTLLRRAARKLERAIGVGIPKVGAVRWGDLRKPKPLSREFGYDRGGPVDRYYIEAFLAPHSPAVRGRVLEVKDRGYTRKFGGERVTASDVLDVDRANPEANLVIDLNDASALPDHAFDCIILTQTLQLIFELENALTHLHRSLRKGGVLLITVPGITPVRTATMTWYWSFTELSLARLLLRHFSQSNMELRTFGNLLSATAFLHGMGASELRTEELDHIDRDYPVIVGARATKAE